MIVFIKKRNLIRVFSAILFVSLSWGAIELAAHPMLGQWQQEKIVVSRVNANQKIIALTFDDGPVMDTTSAVLDALQRNEAHGTFFVLGQRVRQHPDLVRRMANDGHEIGSHSYSHANYNRLKTEAQMEDVFRTNEAIKQISGKEVTLFRPPGGYLSVALVNKCKEEGFTIAHWTYQQDPKDWRNGITASYISKFVLERIEPGQIIILHDGAPNAMQTAKALDILIPKLTNLGYTCVTMSELISLENK